jgi:hypothetical protein
VEIAEEETLQHFRDHGWVRVRGAFSVDAAAAMRAVVWQVLAHAGIREDDASTWTTERPAHLQRVRQAAAFRTVGSARVLRAIDAAFEGLPYERPEEWGSAFVAFPTPQAWNVPSGGWHIDANYLSALSPPDGIRTHALFGDVAPRAGGTLIVSGSHRLVHQYFKDHPPLSRSRAADYRRALQQHPYLHDLHCDGDASERAARFMDRVEEHDGIPLQVIENAGRAGDVMLLHPLVLHVATSNNGTAPRFLLSGGIDRPSMWPQFSLKGS